MRVPQRTNPNDFVDVIELLNDIWCRYSWYPEEKS